MEDSSIVANLQKLSRERLRAMAEAGREVVECHRVLAKTGDNIVSEVLPTDSTFYQFDHCPPGDIYDPESLQPAFRRSTTKPSTAAAKPTTNITQ